VIWIWHLAGLSRHAFLSFLLIAMTGWLECRAETAASVPYASHIEFLKRGDITQVRLHLSQSLRVAVFSLPQPYRLVLDFQKVDFTAIAKPLPHGGTLIKAYRAGLVAPDQSRLVLDVKGPFKLVDVRSQAGAGNSSIVILDLGRVSAAGFQAQGVAPNVQRASAAQSLGSGSLQQQNIQFVVVVDPGHGGLDSGAIGVGRTLEKDIVLVVARRLVRALSAMQGYKVVMTRNKDVFVSLDDRVELARSHRADLFVSLHADAIARANRARKIRGASIYTLSRIASDDRARSFAEKENASDILAGLPISHLAARGRVEAILFDLMRRETEDFSLRLREHLIRRMRRSIRLSRSPRRSANFRVLRQPDTPSVLIELGYMSNAQDVRELTRPGWQSQAADAIAKAVTAYFEERG